MRRTPFIASDAKIREHAFMVLSALYGSEELWKFTPPGGEHEGFTELATIGDEIFENNMVSLASMARANDEGFNTLAVHTEKHPEGVGELVEIEQTSVLTAREACNKIIHAKEATIEWRVLDKHPLYQDIYERKYGKVEQEYRVPFLKVKGERFGKGWEASINLVLWVHAVVFLPNIISSRSFHSPSCAYYAPIMQNVV